MVKRVFVKRYQGRYVPFLITVTVEGKCKGYSSDNFGNIRITVESEPKKEYIKYDIKVPPIILLKAVRKKGDIRERQKKFLDYR